MSERDVVFTLKTKADPKAASAVKEFEDSIVSSQAKIFKNAEHYDKERVRVGKMASQALLKFAEEHRDAILKDAELIKTFSINMAQVTARELNRIDAAQAKSERATRDRENGLKIQSQREAERKIEAEARASLQRRLGDFKKAKAQEVAAAKVAASERDQADSGIQRNKDRFTQAGRNLREQFSELGESVMRVGRGITLLGLAGEKDLEKIQAGLLKAQAAFDLFGGGLKVINKLEKAWAAYLVMIEAANVAVATHNALSIVGGSKGATVKTSTGAIVAGSAGGAATAGFMGFLSRINPLALLGRSASVVPNFNTGKDVLQAGVGIRGWLSGAAAAAGAPQASFAGARVGAAMVGARAIPVVGQMLGAAGLGYGVGNSLSGTLGLKSLGGLIGKNFSGNANQTSDAEKRSSAFIQKNAQLEKEITDSLSVRVGLANSLMTIEDKIFNLRMSGMTDEQKIETISKARESTEKNVYALKVKLANLTNAEEHQRASITASLESHSERLVRLTEQRGDAERAIAQTRSQSAKSSLDAARRELETVTTRIKSEQDALKTAEERFGMMSDTDQTDVLKILQKARGGQQLDRDQISKLKSLGTSESERLASGQARNLANGNYSGQGNQLSQLDESNRLLRSRILDITQGATNKYGVNLGSPRMLSRNQKQNVEAAEYQIEANERRAEQIRLAAARDAALRRSVFGEERGRLSQSLASKSMIEAKVNSQITVVAKFENTATEVADAAVRQLVAAQAPWMAEVERRMNENIKNIGNLQKQRNQLAPGRS